MSAGPRDGGRLDSLAAAYGLETPAWFREESERRRGAWLDYILENVQWRRPLAFLLLRWYDPGGWAVYQLFSIFEEVLYCSRELPWS